MILVVVAVQSVAADRGEILQAVDELADDREMTAIVRVVDRVRLRHAEDAAIHRVGRPGQPDPISPHACPARSGRSPARHHSAIPDGTEIL